MVGNALSALGGLLGAWSSETKRSANERVAQENRRSAQMAAFRQSSRAQRDALSKLRTFRAAQAAGAEPEELRRLHDSLADSVQSQISAAGWLLKCELYDAVRQPFEVEGYRFEVDRTMKLIGRESPTARQQIESLDREVIRTRQTLKKAERRGRPAWELNGGLGRLLVARRALREEKERLVSHRSYLRMLRS